jgi:hypothetical protein
MRGGRLNDEPIVLPRGARAHTANERFLHGGGKRNHKSDEPVRHRSGQSQFFGVVRWHAGGWARNTHPDVPLLRYVGLRTNRGSCSEELRSVAYGRTEWARCNAQFGPIPAPARLGPGAPEEGLGRRTVAERTSENPVSRRSSVEPRSDGRGFLG